MADNTQQLEILSSGLGLTEEQLALLTSNLETLKTAQLSELSEAVARAKEGTRLTRRGFDLLGTGACLVVFYGACIGDIGVLNYWAFVHCKELGTYYASVFFLECVDQLLYGLVAFGFSGIVRPLCLSVLQAGCYDHA